MAPQLDLLSEVLSDDDGQEASASEGTGKLTTADVEKIHQEVAAGEAFVKEVVKEAAKHVVAHTSWSSTDQQMAAYLSKWEQAVTATLAKYPDAMHPTDAMLLDFKLYLGPEVTASTSDAALGSFLMNALHAKKMAQYGLLQANPSAKPQNPLGHIKLPPSDKVKEAPSSVSAKEVEWETEPFSLDSLQEMISSVSNAPVSLAPQPTVKQMMEDAKALISEPAQIQVGGLFMPEDLYKQIKEHPELLQAEANDAQKLDANMMGLDPSLVHLIHVAHPTPAPELKNLAHHLADHGVKSLVCNSPGAVGVFDFDLEHVYLVVVPEGTKKSEANMVETWLKQQGVKAFLTSVDLEVAEPVTSIFSTLGYEMCSACSGFFKSEEMEYAEVGDDCYATCPSCVTCSEDHAGVEVKVVGHDQNGSPITATVAKSTGIKIPESSVSDQEAYDAALESLQSKVKEHHSNPPMEATALCKGKCKKPEMFLSQLKAGYCSLCRKLHKCWNCGSTQGSLPHYDKSNGVGHINSGTGLCAVCHDLFGGKLSPVEFWFQKVKAKPLASGSYVGCTHCGKSWDHPPELHLEPPQHDCPLVKEMHPPKKIYCAHCEQVVMHSVPNPHACVADKGTSSEVAVPGMSGMHDPLDKVKCGYCGQVMWAAKAKGHVCHDGGPSQDFGNGF